MQNHAKNDAPKDKKDARKEEVKKLFTSLTEDEKNDVTELSCVLTSLEIVTNILKKLEAKVAEKMQEKLKLAQEQLSKEEKEKCGLSEDDFLDPDEKHHRHKILSDVLYQWAIENELVETDEEGHGKFLRFNLLLADGNQFLAHINKGQFFKDRGTPTGSHGVWSHFIQWYVIAEHFKSLGEKSPLKQPILDLYKMCGDPKKCISKDKKQSLWFWLCDDNSSSKEEHDFRSPDRLHSFMVKEKNGFKYLRQFVQYNDLKKKMSDKSVEIPTTTTSTYDPNTGKKKPWE